MKTPLQYFFNFIIIFNTVFKIKLSFKLRIDQKSVLSKTSKKFRRSGKNFSKTSGNPEVNFLSMQPLPLSLTLRP